MSRLRFASSADLEALGVQISIDRFGTGYSSLSQLRWLHVDEIKIDQSFLPGLDPAGASQRPSAATKGTDGLVGVPGAERPARDDNAVLGTIVGLAQTLGTRAVAEGVEAGEQHATLVELGCECAQGNYYYEPVPADRLLDLMRADASPARPPS